MRDHLRDIELLNLIDTKNLKRHPKNALLMRAWQIF